LIAIAVITMFTLFLLKRNGRITSYVPTVFMKKVHNSSLSYKKVKDSELLTIANKNYNKEGVN
jgi:hypothetical protein